MRDFLGYCLRSAGLSPEDVDLVAGNKWVHRDKRVPPTAGMEHVEYQAALFGRRVPGVAVNHHLAHVAAAYYTSPFSKATVLTIDGGGDQENAAFAACVDHRIEAYHPMSLENVACWWATMTFNNYRMPRLHYVDPGSGSGKIMALAAYGAKDKAVQTRLAQDMRGHYRRYEMAPPSVAFHDDEDLSDTRSPRSQALARALQEYTERFVGRLFKEAYRWAPAENLCYGGGLALNCVANAKALGSSSFERLHVPPCANDSGIALGMALYAHHHLGNRPRQARYFDPHTGPVYPKERLKAAAKLAAGAAADSRATAGAVSDAIAQGDIVAVYRQRGECGPRALGHRSLLARTDLPGLRDRLNAHVKRREWYRPYAPIVLEERAAELFEGPDLGTPYMSLAAKIRPAWRRRLSEVCHVDGTTRPQVLRREFEPFVYDMVRGVADRIGIPAVLNTSFNRQAPMVETPEEAVELFMDLPVRHLVLEDRLLTKRGEAC